MLKRLLHFALAAALLAGGTGAIAPADTLTPAATLERVLTAPNENSDWFSAGMLAVAPLAQVNAAVTSIRTQLGTFVKLTGDGSGGNFVVIYSGGTIPAYIHLDAEGKIDHLFFSAPLPTIASLADALSRMKSTSGTLSYVVIQSGKERAAAGQDKPQAVGSTFKLAVLAALEAQVRADKRRWSDVVRLRGEWKSLPTGFLQRWPDGSHVTLETLASLMISVSDNTAADTLIHTLGRAAIEPYAGTNVPFLTTHDVFALKYATAAGARAAWRAGDPAKRRAMIPALDAAALPLEGLDMSPAYDDIEWDFTNRQLCALMASVRSLPLFAINPGIATPSDWQRVSFKGGSDAGVISMTTWLTSKNGTEYCVSATLNDAIKPVDESSFTSGYAGVLHWLRDEAAKP